MVIVLTISFQMELLKVILYYHILSPILKTTLSTCVVKYSILTRHSLSFICFKSQSSGYYIMEFQLFENLQCKYNMCKNQKCCSCKYRSLRLFSQCDCGNFTLPDSLNGQTSKIGLGTVYVTMVTVILKARKPLGTTLPQDR